MALWLKLVLGTLALVLLGQIAGRSDRALRARRWAPLIYLPLMLVTAMKEPGTGLWWGWAGIALMLDELVSGIRYDWRHRKRRQLVA